VSRSSRLSAVLPYWPDAPAQEALEVASAAERHGFDELWVGEMATYDAFALATAIGMRCPALRLTIGPLAVHVRDPVTLATGVASVAGLTGRPAGLALGTSSPAVVRWHGRERVAAAAILERSAAEVRRLLAGERSEHGFRLRLPPGSVEVTVAGFGERAIEVAARHADRMVVNLVTVEAAARLRDALVDAAARAGRQPPPLAAWVVAAVDPSDEVWQQASRGLVAYLGAPGYREVLAEAGAHEAVELARRGAHPREQLAAVPRDAIASIGLLGDAATVARRAAEYRAAGIDELCVVPATAGDRGGARTLAALAAAT
jgi:probable F420-dependent oxidoreductase